MFLSTLSLVNFKNYAKATYTFHSRITCFVGRNGIGKTNLLDAIYYLCLTKSYFHAVDQYNIRHGEDFFRLDAKLNSKGREYQLKCILQKGKRKEFFKDEVKYEKLAEHVGQFPVVIITPDDNQLISGGSEERRRYLDALLSQIDRLYLEHLQAYMKVLEQRNALLKRFADHQFFDRDMVQVYDAALVEHGDYIYHARKQVVVELEPIFNSIYGVLSQGHEQVKLGYESGMNDAPLDVLLSKDLEKDRILKRTSAGIHRDDLLFEMDGYITKRFGSQGQQKSFLLSLKLAQYHLLQQHTGTDPLLLLDDIFDKLDAQRSAQLLDYLCTQPFGQVFITDTQRARLEQYFDEHVEKAEMIEMGED